MTAARQHILDTLARTCRTDSPMPDDVSVSVSRPIPARGRDRDPESRIRRFMDEAALAGSDVLQSSSLSGVPETIIRYLDGKGAGLLPRVSDDPLVSGLAWPDGILRGPAEPGDRVTVSVALAAIAETGTLALASSAENPALYAFIPTIHIAVVPKSRVVGHYEQVWALLRQGSGNGNGQAIMPRSLNFITGPSRTADIEQTLLMGAHGPHSHAVVLVDEKE